VQQAQIQHIIQTKIFDRLGDVILDDVGVVNTNAVEKVAGIVALYRRKSRFYNMNLEVVKTSLGLLHAQSLALFRHSGDDEKWVWEDHLFSPVGFGVVSNREGGHESMVTPEMKQEWLTSLARRVKRHDKRQESEERKKIGDLCGCYLLCT